jgi:hypothetical protein
VGDPAVLHRVEPSDGGLGQVEPGVGLLALRPGVGDDPQLADDEGQAEALPDEGREDHREGQEDQQVALRERLA